MGYIDWKKRQIKGITDWIKGTPPKKINAYNPKARDATFDSRAKNNPRLANNNPSTRGKQMKTHK